MRPVIVIVQARMTSTRLPGKVLKEVLKKPLLKYQLERLKRINNSDEVVIATTTNDTDQPIVNLCRELLIPCFRGSEEDVLARYYKAAVEFKAGTIVRITADCPVIDPEVTSKTIKYYLENAHIFDYAATQNYPRGLDTEVFSFKALEEAFYKATAKPDREHVTPYLYKNKGQYRTGNFVSPVDYSYHRWTVDTWEDFELIKLIIENLYPANPKFSLEDILDLLAKNPQWVLLNSSVKQRQYGQ